MGEPEEEIELGITRSTMLRFAYIWCRFWLIFMFWIIWKGVFQVVENLDLWERWLISLGVTSAFSALFLPVLLKLRQLVKLAEVDGKRSEVVTTYEKKIAALQGQIEAQETKLAFLQRSIAKAEEKKKAMKDLLEIMRETDD